MRLRTLFVVTFAALVVAGPCSAQSLEEAWLFKDNAVLIKCTQIDELRGFNKISIEERSLDAATQNNGTRYPLLSDDQWAHFQRSGEFELFQIALKTALTHHKLQHEKAGWEPPLIKPDSTLPKFGLRSVKQEVQIFAQRDTPEASLLLWQQPQFYQDIGFERKANQTLMKVVSASTSRHGNTVALAVSTVPSIHAQALIRTRILLFDRAQLLKALPSKPTPKAAGEI